MKRSKKNLSRQNNKNKGERRKTRSPLSDVPPERGGTHPNRKKPKRTYAISL
jgi:hypothetical protein